jgi:hypothetical protein
MVGVPAFDVTNGSQLSMSAAFGYSIGRGVVYGYLRAFLCEQSGYRGTDTARAPGDQCNFVSQAAHLALMGVFMASVLSRDVTTSSRPRVVTALRISGAAYRPPIEVAHPQRRPLDALVRRRTHQIGYKPYQGATQTWR